jgi:hypothetical protein
VENHFQLSILNSQIKDVFLQGKKIKEEDMQA